MMKIEDYIELLPSKGKLSKVKLKILTRLWGNDQNTFPKPWVSSSELLELTGQKYFDRRARELRDVLGCDIESSYRDEYAGYAWRIVSPKLALSQKREYLTQAQKEKLFKDGKYICATCGVKSAAGIRGLQADHKVPLSRSGGNDLANWQPMCNNCNVGKRRACEGCQLDCQTCSWAFPEKVGIKTILSISERTLRRVDAYSSKIGQSPGKIMEEAAEYYLDKKDAD